MDKFKYVDPTDPNSCMGAMGRVESRKEEEKGIYETVTAEVDKRMSKAARELQKKYASGRGGDDASDNGPTGASYTAAAQNEREQMQMRREKERAARVASDDAAADREADVRSHVAQENDDGGGGQEYERDSDDDLLDELDDDPAIRKLRDMRIAGLKAEHSERQENLRKGHGSYEEIVQDEFLKVVTGSKLAVCHFYHKEFARCKIMDKHLAHLAHFHLETKFCRIDAEKTPFFVDKLKIRVLPTVICCFDGISTQEQRVVGFQEIRKVPGQNEDEWPTEHLAELLGKLGVIDYTRPPSQAELSQFGLSKENGSIRVGRGHDAQGDY